jgi:hypothetical protein
VAISSAVQSRCRIARPVGFIHRDSGHQTTHDAVLQASAAEPEAKLERSKPIGARGIAPTAAATRPSTGLTDQTASAHRSPHPHPCHPLSLTGLERRSARRNFDPFLILGTWSDFRCVLGSRNALSGGSCALGGGDSVWSLVKIPHL